MVVMPSATLERPLWRRVFIPCWIAPRFRSIAVAPDNPDQIYAALRAGELIASDDGGSSWVKLDVRAPSVSDMQYVAA